MTVLAWIATLVTATVHILVFVGESLLFQHPRVHQGVFSVPTADVPPVRRGPSTSASTTSSLAAA